MNPSKPLTFICIQKINFISHFVYKTIQQFDWCRTLTWANPSKVRKLLAALRRLFIFVKNQGNPSNIFWDICLLRILQFDWLSRHAWPHLLKMLIPPCRKLWCFSACKKSHLLFTRYYTSRNPFIWLALINLNNLTFLNWSQSWLVES